MNKSIYTDLAMEARELSGESAGIVEENGRKNGVAVSRITITDAQTGEHMGKLPGTYVTLDAPELIERDSDLFRSVALTLASELKALIGELKEDAVVLVAGLGNRSVTPDSLGPAVVDRIMVTRHIKELLPEVLPSSVRAVCAIAPGVMGVTGVETQELLRGVVENVSPDVMIVVDSLASRRAARISTTVQLADTGIAPGSGVGNTRAGLNSAELNIPVIAVGVPLVVNAATIAEDVIDLIDNGGDREALSSRIKTVIDENIGELIVTPKDIDTILDDMAGILAEGINRALFGAEYDGIAALTS